MYKLCFFVPEANVDKVKQAVFDVGGGRIGSYDCCSWQTAGCGQFRPLQGSRPYLGQEGVIEQVSELKVELVCDAATIKAAVSALKEAHPYETPAFDVIRLEEF